MFSNIKEVLMDNRCKECLTIPREDYFQIFDELTIKDAQELANIYFLSLSRKDNGIVEYVKEDHKLGLIKIGIEIKNNILINGLV